MPRTRIIRRRLPNTVASRRAQRVIPVAEDVSNPPPSPQLRRRRRHASQTNVIPYRQQQPITRTIWRGPVDREFRHGEWLHVSDLVHTCIRKMALSEQLNIPMPMQQIWDGQGITFKIGEAIAEFVTTKVEERDDQIYGMWKCDCKEDNLIIGPMTKAEAEMQNEGCSMCNQKALNYKEMTFRNEALQLLGNVDLCFLYDALLITEIKSMARTSWDRLTHPIPDHIVQVVIYWWLARELGIRLYDSVSIMYVCKEWKFGSPYKEYVVNAEENLDLVEPYLEEARQYIAFKRGDGPLPIRVTCDTPEDTRAGKCEFCNECFEDG